MDWKFIEETYSLKGESAVGEVVRKVLQKDRSKSALHRLNPIPRPSLNAKGNRELCCRLFECIRLSPKRHFALLDNVLKESFQCSSHQAEPDVPLSVGLLGRLPTLPASMIELNDAYCEPEWDTQWDDIYVAPNSWIGSPESTSPESVSEATKRRSQILKSSRLKVARYIDSNTILHALSLSPHGSISHKAMTATINNLTKYSNLLASLTDVAIETNMFISASQRSYGFEIPNEWVAEQLGLENFCDCPAYAQSRLIVIMFLWVAWQRSIMLLLYHDISARLDQQGRSYPATEYSIDGNLMLSCYIRSDFLSEHQTPQYMCPWALSLIRSRRSCTGLDVRRLIFRFQAQFGNRPARCLTASQEQCLGKSSEECERFLTKQPEDQHFAHDDSCSRKPCMRIKWDESSYRQTPNPRAVRVRSDLWREEDRLGYCQAGKRTLAVSHVWSHGQGGRPEEGINVCLHHRYCRLAEDHGCDSYWIDTGCIPDDRILRIEAIRKINDVFQDSKITLICDKDLMEIDIPTTIDLGVWETIIATLLVCDWNVRAWTLLEAVKGRLNLCILTKRNRMVKFLDGALLLARSGPLDLVALLTAADYLLPSPASTSQFNGFEEVGHVLSHRHASRSGDDVAIWGLLSTGCYHESMPKLLLAVRYVRTGFLISSSPRCTIESFGWAPQTPRLRSIKGTRYPIQPDPFESHYPVKIYHSYDGKGSLKGQVTAGGFKASWLALILRTRSELTALAPWNENFGHETWEYVITLFETYTSVALLRALEDDGQTPWRASDQQGQEAGLKLVVCASNVIDHWEWKGVFEAPYGVEPNSIYMDSSYTETKYAWRVVELTVV